MLNDAYSFKDFTGQSLVDVPVEDLSDTTIKGTCFAQQGQVSTVVFPTAMSGVTFDRCNLDNVFVPTGNTVNASCAHRKILVQNDGEDWILDENSQPVDPISKTRILEDGGNVDPAKIPETKVT